MVRRWPGNDIPVFRNNITALKELETVVEGLVEECQFPQAGFDKKAIRQHALDIMTERRRSVKKGHDYTQVYNLLGKVT